MLLDKNVKCHEFYSSRFSSFHPFAEKKFFYKGKENDTKSEFLLCKAEFKLFFNLEAYLSSNLNNLLFIHISCKEKNAISKSHRTFQKGYDLRSKDLKSSYDQRIMNKLMMLILT